MGRSEARRRNCWRCRIPSLTSRNTGAALANDWPTPPPNSGKAARLHGWMLAALCVLVCGRCLCLCDVCPSVRIGTSDFVVALGLSFSHALCPWENSPFSHALPPRPWPAGRRVSLAPFPRLPLNRRPSEPAAAAAQPLAWMPNTVVVLLVPFCRCFSPLRGARRKPKPLDAAPPEGERALRRLRFARSRPCCCRLPICTSSSAKRGARAGESSRCAPPAHLCSTSVRWGQQSGARARARAKGSAKQAGRQAGRRPARTKVRPVCALPFAPPPSSSPLLLLLLSLLLAAAAGYLEARRSDSARDNGWRRPLYQIAEAEKK